MTSPWRPSSRSASIRSSSATSRSSSSRRISACAKSSNANSASAGPRQSVERALEQLAPLRRREPPRVRERALEPVRVDLLGLDAEDVAGRARLEDVRARAPSGAARPRSGEMSSPSWARPRPRAGRRGGRSGRPGPATSSEDREQRALPLARRARSGRSRPRPRAARVSGIRASRATLGHRASSCPARAHETRGPSRPAQEPRLASRW